MAFADRDYGKKPKRYLADYLRLPFRSPCASWAKRYRQTHLAEVEDVMHRFIQFQLEFLPV